MCRLLAVRTTTPRAHTELISAFALACKNSHEYQGDGWGAAYLTEAGLTAMHSPKPIWEDDYTDIPQTTLLLVHARSAFNNTGVTLAHNMPFMHNNLAFIFNGELRGVRLNQPGRIGAEKIFSLVKSLGKQDVLTGMRRAQHVLMKRSEFVRANNIIMANDKHIYVHTHYADEKEYFTLHVTDTPDELIVCSEPLPNIEWRPIENNITLQL